jgi:hypothetical protein
MTIVHQNLKVLSPKSYVGADSFLSFLWFIYVSKLNVNVYIISGKKV